MSVNESALTLTVRRKPQFFLVNPPIRVMLDSQQAVELKKKGVIPFTTTPGAHLLSFHYRVLGVTRVTVIQFSLAADATVTVGFNRQNDKMDVEASVPTEIIEQR